MKKIFIDTDIILDLLANRKSFYLPAAQVFSLADNGKLHIHVSSLTLATLYYLLSKDSGQEKAEKILFKFKSIVTVLPVDNKTIELALSSDFKGFEDGVQYFCAIESKCSAILTRNIIGYKHSQIPVMTAESFLNIL